jgi:hypothetical protein
MPIINCYLINKTLLNIKQFLFNIYSILMNILNLKWFLECI